MYNFLSICRKYILYGIGKYQKHGLKNEEEFCKRQLTNYGYLGVTQSAKEV